ncbi:putative bifunctional diguanylate cyclase/phosphodiesterase [Polycladidibacter hongkongensis]|uniref:putative bifunctional diguanylate cyclase/phosphodiesterase n=1 Tax=Polycladidibacter hongkongensis TaxID=1647556 RepID=UPI00082C399F|nr:EAL domain-containing protein [Pseudovibrio hongkongensis]
MANSSTIVVIDDRAVNRSILTRLTAVAAPDYASISFADPLAALDYMRTNQPALIVTDYSMPEMDGAELTQAVRGIEGLDAIPILVITAYSDSSFKTRALEAGASGFIQSPIDHRVFELRVQELLATQLTTPQLAELPCEHPLAALSSDKLINDISAFVTVVDRQGIVAFVNQPMADFVGKAREQIIGQPIGEAVSKAANIRTTRLDAKVFESRRSLPPYEVEVTHSDGETLHFLVQKKPLLDTNGHVSHVVTTSFEITERKRLEAHLLHMAHHDGLTGLPNRTYLRERIDEEVQRCRRNGGMFALHFLDLDRFKSINDALGHRTGDQLLEVVAQRLLADKEEPCVIARLGGDEFAILQPGLVCEMQASNYAHRVVELLTEPVFISGKELRVSASVGVTIYPNDGSSSDELLRHADLAMYQSKAEGGRGFQLFARQMDEQAQRTISLESALHRALEEGQFELFFQPQYNLRSRQLIGAEALLRWNRPEHGLVSPDIFLGAAEETGLILPISEWVMLEACRQAKHWHECGLTHLHVAVNLSATQFRRQNVCELVEQTLQLTGLPARALELEITEQVVMLNPDSIAPQMERLRENGCRILIDDFGTGYSSLAYLNRFSIDGLKIDRCFTQDLLADNSSKAIVNAIIGLGRTLDLTVLAEGIETGEQAVWLRQAGCVNAQGFYYGQGVPSEAFVGTALAATFPAA